MSKSSLFAKFLLSSVTIKKSEPYLPILTSLSKSTDYSTRKYCTHLITKDHTYDSIGKEDFDEIIPIVMDYFVSFEPISMGIGASYKENKEFYENYAKDYLESNFSVGARNKEGKLVGLLLAKKQTKEDSVSENSAILEYGNSIEKHNLDILRHVQENYDIFSKQGVDEVLYQAMVLVDPEYKSQGILRKLVEISNQKAVEKGLTVSYGIATGIATQKTGPKLGYTTVLQIQYKTFDFLNLKAMGDNTCMKVIVKKLV